jgi:hypothetical protein
MEFADIAAIIQTGGHSALMVLLWFVYQNWRTSAKALETLQAIAGKLDDAAKTQERTVDKIDALHVDVIELPVNLMRILK